MFAWITVVGIYEFPIIALYYYLFSSVPFDSIVASHVGYEFFDELHITSLLVFLRRRIYFGIVPIFSLFILFSTLSIIENSQATF